MRVGILTFTHTINFGASLQAYALQETIRSFGADAEIIEYTNKEIERKEKNLGFKKLSVKGLVREFIMGPGLRKKTKAFDDYESTHINSGKLLNNTSFNEVNSYYDLFITGSDQVWNMSIINEDWHYFLDFVTDNNKIVSYAPSFGNVPFPRQYYTKAAELLMRFRALSVREVYGKKLIHEICGRESQVVLDPTLLLDKVEWQERISFVPTMKNYILVYFPHNKKRVFDFVKRLKQKTGLPVVYLSISPKIQLGTKTIYDASPDEFLGWILHADYVVTGSFHGTAFSLNFGKQFYYEPSGEGSRIDNIVKLCGAEDRSIETSDLDSIIDYGIVQKKLGVLRKESKSWLIEALKK